MNMIYLVLGTSAVVTKNVGRVIQVIGTGGEGPRPIGEGRFYHYQGCDDDPVLRAALAAPVPASESVPDVAGVPQREPVSDVLGQGVATDSLEHDPNPWYPPAPEPLDVEVLYRAMVSLDTMYPGAFNIIAISEPDTKPVAELLSSEYARLLAARSTEEQALRVVHSCNRRS